MHMIEHMYLDRNGYEDRHPQRRSLYEENEHHVYGRAPIPYVIKQHVVGDVSPRVFASTRTLPPHPLGSIVPAAHVKELQLSNVIEDVYNFEFYNP